MNIQKHVQPTFLLKNIDPNELYKQFRAGHFNRPIPTKSKITFIKPQSKLTTVERQVITTGEKDIQLFKQGIVNGGRCDYCKLDFTTEKEGYPIAYEQHQIVTDIYKQIHVFWVDGCFCSTSCCLSFVATTRLNVDIELLKYMTKLRGIPIKYANSPSLLNEMTKEEWSNKTFKKTNVIKVPVQTVFNALKM